ncbi:MAG: hypothetical protein A2X49_11665 [Lentisphaerae bacterium GWF2_52_8]|nr:MAG: hypothetical protein A2X49_11665 [Lentisphaerae bacterium GWF2_52_8]
MDAFQEWLFKLTGKKVSMRTLLIALIMILSVFVFFVKRAVDSSNAPPRPLPGAVMALKCSSCDYVEDRRIVDIDEAKCPKCGAPMGYKRKCMDCSFEFSYMPQRLKNLMKTEPNRFKVLEALAVEQACPNCHSGNTESMFPGSVDKK